MAFLMNQERRWAAYARDAGKQRLLGLRYAKKLNRVVFLPLFRLWMERTTDGA